MQEEIFGPILPVFTYKNIDEAIQFINKKDKPLAVYYFGKNSSSNKNLMRVKHETYSGAFLVNEIVMHFVNQYLPFGGVGASGYGRCHGHEGFKQCSNQKSIMMKTGIKFWPFNVTNPPFTPENQRVVRLMCAKLDLTQSQLFKRFILFLIVIWVIWLVATKRLTIKKLRKYK